LVEKHRKNGRKIIVVQGLGFVGAINAAVIADTKVKGKKSYFVIGIDQATPNSFWKIELINRGECPYKSEDIEVEKVYQRTAGKDGNFRATWISEAFSFADIVLVDINLDVIKKEFGNAIESTVAIDPFRNAIKDIGINIDPRCLILVETSVPPGATRKIIEPIISDCFKARGIDIQKFPPKIAHSYERIMPGKDYVNSIRNMWRTYSGINESSKEKAREFLKSIGNTRDYPLWELSTPDASELAKILENSYRAMNIAFIQEWTKLAEDIGVNLFDIVRSIRVRKGTHDNMMFPGFGVGGYCLTKDPLLAQWSSKELFDRKENLELSVEAVNINDLMPDHTFDLLMKALKNKIKGKKIAILGASYRKDIDDTRNSPTIRLYDRIKESGGRPFVHDPYAKKITQREDIKVHSSLDEVLSDSQGVVLVVNHRNTLNSRPRGSSQE
jgi:nucleotide sugar dehydrogenase